MTSGFIGNGRFGSGGIAGAGGAAGGDAFFSSVSALLHFNGTNGDTTTVDSSTHAHTVTVGGACALSNTQVKFGSTSMNIPGAGADTVTLPYHSSLDLTTGDFTVECFARFTTDAANRGFITLHDGTGGAIVLIANSSNQFVFKCTSDGFSGVVDIEGGTVAPNTWYHIAATRSGSTFRLFVDGTQIGTDATSAATLWGAGSTHFWLGSIVGNQRMTGYLDDVRITKGVARYTTNFPPPAAEFYNPP